MVDWLELGYCQFDPSRSNTSETIFHFLVEFVSPLSYFWLLQAFGHIGPAVEFVVVLEAKERQILEFIVGRILVKVRYLAFHNLIDTIEPKAEAAPPSTFQQHLLLHFSWNFLSVRHFS